jgi:hypothetical protein
MSLSSLLCSSSHLALSHTLVRLLQAVFGEKLLQSFSPVLLLQSFCSLPMSSRAHLTTSHLLHADYVCCSLHAVRVVHRCIFTEPSAPTCPLATIDVFVCAEAEAIPLITAAIRLRKPLQPRAIAPHWKTRPLPQTASPSPTAGIAPSLSSSTTTTTGGCRNAAPWQLPQQAPASIKTLTLHLHTFVYGHPATSTAATTHVSSSCCKASEATANPRPSGPSAAEGPSAPTTAEQSLLASLLGSSEALAALPGGPAVAGGMQQPPLGKLCFGVLLWEQLPPWLMQWPVWMERQLYVVSASRCSSSCLSLWSLWSDSCVRGAAELDLPPPPLAPLPPLLLWHSQEVLSGSAFR